MRNPRLNTYIRIDGSGRDVPGTNILRLKMPVTGRWRQLEAYECCYAASEVTFTPDDFETDNTITLSCDGDVVAVFTVASSSPTTVEDFAATLNAALGYVGVFSASGDDVVLKLKLEVAETLCPDPADITIETSTV